MKSRAARTWLWYGKLSAAYILIDTYGNEESQSRPVTVHECCPRRKVKKSKFGMFGEVDSPLDGITCETLNVGDRATELKEDACGVQTPGRCLKHFVDPAFIFNPRIQAQIVAPVRQCQDIYL